MATYAEYRDYIAESRHGFSLDPATALDDAVSRLQSAKDAYNAGVFTREDLVQYAFPVVRKLKAVVGGLTGNPDAQLGPSLADRKNPYWRIAYNQGWIIWGTGETRIPDFAEETRVSQFTVPPPSQPNPEQKKRDTISAYEDLIAAPLSHAGTYTEGQTIDILERLRLLQDALNQGELNPEDYKRLAYPLVATGAQITGDIARGGSKAASIVNAIWGEIIFEGFVRNNNPGWEPLIPPNPPRRANIIFPQGHKSRSVFHKVYAAVENTGRLVAATALAPAVAVHPALATKTLHLDESTAKVFRTAGYVELGAAAAAGLAFAGAAVVGGGAASAAPASVAHGSAALAATGVAIKGAAKRAGGAALEELGSIFGRAANEKLTRNANELLKAGEPAATPEKGFFERLLEAIANFVDRLIA